MKLIEFCPFLIIIIYQMVHISHTNSSIMYVIIVHRAHIWIFNTHLCVHLIRTEFRSVFGDWFIK